MICLDAEGFCITGVLISGKGTRCVSGFHKFNVIQVGLVSFLPIRSNCIQKSCKWVTVSDISKKRWSHCKEHQHRSHMLFCVLNYFSSRAPWNYTASLKHTTRRLLLVGGSLIQRVRQGQTAPA